LAVALGEARSVYTTAQAAQQTRTCDDDTRLRDIADRPLALAVIAAPGGALEQSVRDCPDPPQAKCQPSSRTVAGWTAWDLVQEGQALKRQRPTWTTGGTLCRSSCRQLAGLCAGLPGHAWQR